MPLQNMKAIQTVTVGAGGAASIDFTSIPQTYTDLVILISGRRELSTGTGQMSLTFNNSTTGYSSRMLEGTGSAAASNSYSGSNMRIGQAEPSSFTASTYMNTQIYIPNYAGSNNKSVSSDSVSENNATEAYAAMFAGLWSNSAAITSVQLFPADVNDWEQYSTATLYGVSNTIAGGAKAYGGIVTEDANYFYHTFLASGTFTPTQSITADVLVVAGGGAGGTGGIGGGGGAGGFLVTTSQSLTATNYAVTIGAGGVGSTIEANVTSGSNSQFGSITASVGGGVGGCGNPPYKNSGNGGSSGGVRFDSGNTIGTATTGQGNVGARGSSGSSTDSGGGGGAGAAGSPGIGGNQSGAGGAGTNAYSSWATATSTGASGFYAGGGGGGGYTPSPFTSGGAGGSGGGGAGSTVSGTNGTANTGGGGGGGGTSASGSGGSGIVIVRYAK